MKSLRNDGGTSAISAEYISLHGRYGSTVVAGQGGIAIGADEVC